MKKEGLCGSGCLVPPSAFRLTRFNGEQIHYKDGGTAGYSSIVYINYPRKLGMAVLTNTETEPFWLGYNLLRKLTPVLAKSLERSQAKALEEALPKWQKYIGRYVITDPNAIPLITFSEFDVSIVNQKLVITIPEVRPGSIVWMKEVPLEPYGNNDFKIAGGSFGNKFITFEPGNDGEHETEVAELHFQPSALDPTCSRSIRLLCAFPARIGSSQRRRPSSEGCDLSIKMSRRSTLARHCKKPPAVRPYLLQLNCASLPNPLL